MMSCCSGMEGHLNLKRIFKLKTHWELKHTKHIVNHTYKRYWELKHIKHIVNNLKHIRN